MMGYKNIRLYLWSRFMRNPRICFFLLNQLGMFSNFTQCRFLSVLETHKFSFLVGALAIYDGNA